VNKTGIVHCDLNEDHAPRKAPQQRLSSLLRISQRGRKFPSSVRHVFDIETQPARLLLVMIDAVELAMWHMLECSNQKLRWPAVPPSIDHTKLELARHYSN